MTQEELEKILQANQETLARVEKSVEKIKKQMLWAKVGGFLKMILILGPIIVGLFYLSPMLKQYMGGLEKALSILQVAPSSDNQNVQLNQSGIEAICNATTRQAIINQVCN